MSITPRDELLGDLLTVYADDAQLMADMGVATVKTGHDNVKRTYQAIERIYLDIAIDMPALPYIVHEMAEPHMENDGIIVYGKYYVSILTGGTRHEAAKKSSEIESDIYRLLTRLRLVGEPDRQYANAVFEFNRSRWYETGKTTVKHRMLTYDIRWLDKRLNAILAGRAATCL